MEDYKLELHHTPFSRSDRVLWAVYELGLEQQLVTNNVNIIRGEQRSLASISSMRQVPVLVLTDSNGNRQVVTESCGIIMFLAESCDSLLPPLDNLPARAQMHRVVSLAASTVDELVFRVFRHEKFEPDAAISSKARREFARARRMLNEMLSHGKWACAPHYDEFTIADVALGYVLIFAHRIGMLHDAPILQEYVQRCKSRPAFIKVIKHPKASSKQTHSETMSRM